MDIVESRLALYCSGFDLNGAVECLVHHGLQSLAT